MKAKNISLVDSVVEAFLSVLGIVSISKIALTKKPLEESAGIYKEVFGSVSFGKEWAAKFLAWTVVLAFLAKLVISVYEIYTRITVESPKVRVN